MDTPILTGLLASLGAGLATALGALPILFFRNISARTQVVMLAFGAGVMLAASFFSLIAPGLVAAAQSTGSTTSGAFVVAGGVLLGALGIAAIHRLVPHEHFVTGREGRATESLARMWLFVIAITLHNFPEGLAVGVGFGDEADNGTAIAVGIGLQNMPEGLVVAAALAAEGYPRSRAWAVALLSGLVEPIGALAGLAAVSVAAAALPWSLGFAAGAMLFVISSEIIPETHRQNHHGRATAGIMTGFVVMMLLDVTLG